MESTKLLPMVQNAINRKKNIMSVYERFFESQSNPEIRSLVENILERENQHMQLLQNIQESIQNGVDVPAEAFSSANLIGAGDSTLTASKPHREDEYQRPATYPNQFNTSTRSRVRYAKGARITPR
jgi:Mn-containing catalase